MCVCFKKCAKGSDRSDASERKCKPGRPVGPYWFFLGPYWFFRGPLLVFPGIGVRSDPLGLQKRNEPTNFGVVLFAPKCISKIKCRIPKSGLNRTWWAPGPLLVFPWAPTGFPWAPTGFLTFGREVRSLGLQKKIKLQISRSAFRNGVCCPNSLVCQIFVADGDVCAPQMFNIFVPCSQN